MPTGYYKRISKSAEERLMKYVVKGDTHWYWSGAKNKGKYGIIWFDGKPGTTHRLSYRTFVGNIPDSKCVLHACGVRWCIKPSHLYLGTNKDNSNDRIRDGNNAQGERHGRSKLTWKSVQEIRSKYDSGKFIQLQLSKMYGVSGPVISQIVNGKIWKNPY